MTGEDWPVRCARCLLGLHGWFYGGWAPACVWCDGKSGPVRDPRQWEMKEGRVSDACRRAWEHWAKPRQPYDEDPPLSHFFHCWTFPNHYRCAVELIRRLSQENDHLLVRADRAERELARLTARVAP